MNSYVQSLNDEYNPQVHSYSAKSASASDAAKNDASLARSYSAEVNNPNTAKTINSLAAKNHMDPALYQSMVQDQEQVYSNEVSSASADVNANGLVSSLVNRLGNTDLSAASLNASASDVIAASNSVAADDNLQSVKAEYGSYYGSNQNAATFIQIANELSAGATTLQAEGNPEGYNAEVGLAKRGLNANGQSAVDSAIASATSYGVSSAKASLSNLASEASSDNTPLSDYAYNGNDTFNDLEPDVDDVTDGNGDNISAAASEAVDEQFAPTLAAVANSLYGEYRPYTAGYSNSDSAASLAIKSASAKSRAASYAYDFASANQSVIDTVYDDVNTAMGTGSDVADAKANVAHSYLDEGVSNFAKHMGITADVRTDNDQDTNVIRAGGNNAYTNAIANALGNGSKEQKLFNVINTNLGINGGNTTADVKNNILNAKSALESAIALLNSSDGSAKLSNPVNHTTTVPAQTEKVDGSANLSSNPDGSKTLTIPSHSGTVPDQTDKVDGSANLSAPNPDGSKTLTIPSHSGTVSVENIILLIKSKNNNNVVNDILNDTDVVPANLDETVGTLSNKLSNIANVAGSITNENGSVDHGLGDKDIQGSVTEPTYFAACAKAALLSDGIDLDQLESASGAIDNVASAENSAAKSAAFVDDNSDATLNGALSAANSSANSALASAQNASGNYSQANDENVTLASYYAKSYSNDANSESTVASAESTGLNDFFQSMADDPAFNAADDAYAGAKAAAANDYKMGEENSAIVFNNVPHFLDVLKGADLHSSYNFNDANDKILGRVNKGDRLTVLGVNFNRNGRVHGANRYFVLDNATGKKGFFTGQPQYSKSAYLNALYNINNVNVSVKTLKPVAVYDNLNNGKFVKNLPAGTVVNNVTIVSDNPSNDAHGFTKVETSDYNFFTANTDYVELNSVVPKTTNNVPAQTGFDLDQGGVNLGPAYDNNGQIRW